MLSWLNPKIWLALALLAALAAGTAYVYRSGGAAPRAELAARDRADDVAALQRARNAERTNDENDSRTAALSRELKRLREQPKFAPGPAPIASKCPEGQLCFDSAEFAGAYGVFRGEIREIAGQCAKVELDLDSARKFENGN